MAVTDCSKITYSFCGGVGIARLRQFLLDIGVNQTDNLSVRTLVGLIYSPSDMPYGLRRGFAFWRSALEGTHAC